MTKLIRGSKLIRKGQEKKEREVLYSKTKKTHKTMEGQKKGVIVTINGKTENGK